MEQHLDVLEDLREPLAELGRRWARSEHRPHPTAAVLGHWDALLSWWLASDLPLILRDSARRGEFTTSTDGRKIVFGDNTPANWSLGLALAGEVPDLSSWTAETIAQRMPLSFTSRAGFKRDLNRYGWKVCHIDSVSDRKRYRVEGAQFSVLEERFIRFMSPRNMFVVPKVISGAGELPEVVRAIAEFEQGRSLSQSTSASK